MIFSPNVSVRVAAAGFVVGLWHWLAVLKKTREISVTSMVPDWAPSKKISAKRAHAKATKEANRFRAADRKSDARS
jgi:hypothetical protein